MSYAAVHRELRRRFGPARRYACVGCSGPAAHWAYAHTDPAPRREPNGLVYGTAEHYRPMCEMCHAQLDGSALTTAWRASAVTIPCTYCGAAIGELCRTEDGRSLRAPTAQHQRRRWQHNLHGDRPAARTAEPITD